jgi:hypothetical protein
MEQKNKVSKVAEGENFILQCLTEEGNFQERRRHLKHHLML